MQLLTAAEVRAFGEEPVQLQEGGVYEYKVIDTIASLRVRENDAVIRSRMASGSADTGRIEPGINAGVLPLILEDEQGDAVGRAAVEVQPSKLSYRTDYRRMLEYIATKSIDLLMDIKEPIGTRFLPDPGHDPQTIQQRVAFLQSILDSTRFRDALHRVVAMPHRTLEREQRERNVCRGFRPDGSTLRQVAAGLPRVPLPASHPLAARMVAAGIVRPSVPREVSVVSHRDITDTAENRFVKHTLEVYANFLRKVEAALLPDSAAVAPLRREVRRLRADLDATLAQDFFREISPPDILPLGSPVLQRKPGYREILQIWLRFNLAARLVWSGADDVYGAGKRDMAVLYEFWLFFQLLNLVVAKFDLEEPPVASLMERRADGFGLKLKSGKSLVLRARLLGTRPLSVRLDYNRVFRHTDDWRRRGSWTRILRPDFTLGFWPTSMTTDEAEAQNLMVHIHFDAKYRAESITDLFGSEEEDVQDDKIAERRGTYKRADLLKMHAYRDAIRRTEGAYVLYPGDRDQTWRGFHEILPGVGAFAIRPGRDGEPEGLGALADFIDVVAAHIRDRATRREQAGYHVYRTQSGPDPHPVFAPLPETDPGTKSRTIPLQEHRVLVCRCDDADHLAWVNTAGLYVFAVDPVGELSGVPLRVEVVTARHLLLYVDGAIEPGLWRVKELGVRLWSDTELVTKGYPGQRKPGVTYVGFAVERDSAFARWEWNSALLTELQVPPQPVELTLDTLIARFAIRPVG